MSIFYLTVVIFVAYCSITILLTRTNYFLSKRRIKERLKMAPDSRIIGFFHPFCDAGAGGEKVLF